MRCASFAWSQASARFLRSARFAPLNCALFSRATKKRAAAACCGFCQDASAKRNGALTFPGRWWRARLRHCLQSPREQGSEDVRLGMPVRAQKIEKLPGTRPEGVRNEHEAAPRVQQMFGQIAPRYDLLNHLLSFWLDHLWRWNTAQ